MQITNTSTQKGPRGLATVKTLSKNVRVLFQDDKLGEYRFDFDNVPAGKIDGEMWVEVSKDGEKLYDLKPTKAGSHFVKFVGFSHGKDKPPTPFPVKERQMQGGKWSIPSHMGFGVNLEFIGGKHAGMRFWNKLTYAFVADEKDPQVSAVQGRGRDLDELTNFMGLCGFDVELENIPFSDNVLPKLEGLLQSRSKGGFFMLTLKDGGWVDSLSEAPVGMPMPK
jgi:hypothetical protein